MRDAYDAATNHMPVMDQPHRIIKNWVGDVIGVSARALMNDAARRLTAHAPTRDMTSASEPPAQIL